MDPALFFDLVKVRRLVEEATDLAVRAANGTASSSLNNALHAGNGILGGGNAVALGLGRGGGATNAKLSRERKHRMRELATQKLSHAYHLDEIAASVATMQSTSSLEDVAKLVLQRNGNNSDAQYVHFFHEKIPTRMLAQYTSLDPLNNLVRNQPTDGAPLRTRAVTRILKDDFPGAIRDLTEGLNVCRFSMVQHKESAKSMDLTILSGKIGIKKLGYREGTSGFKIEDKDQPVSLEPQLLFQRAGVYLTLACRNIGPALEGLHPKLHHNQPASAASSSESVTISESSPKEAQKRHLEARKIVRMNAKRALRDYINFLGCFEYTPGLPVEAAEDSFARRMLPPVSLRKPKTTPQKLF